jgi:putative ABC transport system permease protein
MNYPWLFTMAWSDSRRNRSRLLLFMSSIVLGIAALVAINSFGDSMQRDVELEAKKLLGADLVVESRFPFSDRVLRRLDSLAERQSEEVSFASMVLFPKNDGSRLVQVRALQLATFARWSLDFFDGSPILHHQQLVKEDRRSV